MDGYRWKKTISKNKFFKLWLKGTIFIHQYCTEILVKSVASQENNFLELWNYLQIWGKLGGR